MMRYLALVLLLLPLPAAAESWHARCAAAEPARAVKPCEEALIDDPEDLLALKRLADFYLGNHGEWHAVELYARRIELDPENPEAYFDHAAALATLWYFAEASPSMHQALRLDPDNVMTQRLAAIVFEQSGEAEAAFAAHLALAEAGETIGMYDLAKDYRDGTGTAADPAGALRWFAAAAEGGHVLAMEHLADGLEAGSFGQPADPAAAAAWRAAAKAARAGFAD
jgi:tetratricopeptide (TPR) repeat protein